MAGSRKSGGTNVALTTRKRRSGGVWVDLTTAKRRSGGVWVDMFPSSVTVSPASALGVVLDLGGPSSATVTSNSVTASGASTYSWARISGDSGVSTASGNSATTAFTATVTAGTPISATFRVTGDNGGTFDVPVELTYSN